MKTNLKKISMLWSATLLAFLFGCGHEKDVQTQREPVNFPESMKTITVEQTNIPIFYETVGTVSARSSTVLSAKITGQIRQINVDEGDSVKAKDVLVVIDDRDIEEKINQAMAAFSSAQNSLNEINAGIAQAKAQKQQAEANYNLSLKNFERYESLHKEKAVSAQEFDTVKANLKVAKAQLDTAEGEIVRLTAKKNQVADAINMARSGVQEANVGKTYTQIIAPFDGVIIKKYVDVGGLAVPGAPLLDLENPVGFRLEVDVRETEFANKVSLGSEVQVQIDALAGYQITGRVAEAVPSANPMSRSFKVRIALPQIDGLKTGMYGKAMCPRGERQGILIPKTALIQRGQLEQIFTVDDQRTAHLRLVKSGRQFDDKIEILSGLNSGDIVIIDPKPGLKDRYIVTVN